MARETGRYYGADHHEAFFSAKDFSDNIDDAVYYNDEPISDPIQVVNLALTREARKEVAVVLGGDGGDELFGGYSRYYYAALIDRFQKAPLIVQKAAFSLFKNFSKNKTATDKLRLPQGFKRYLAFMVQKDEVLGKVLKSELFKKESTDLFFDKNYYLGAIKNDSAKQMMYLDLKTWLVDESLMRTDRMTMGYGLEERVPILDHRIAELAFRIPTRFKIKGKDRGKEIFKEAGIGYKLIADKIQRYNDM